MSKSSNLFVFERTENFNGLLVYCREILKFSNQLTEEVINVVIDRVLNGPVMHKSLTLDFLKASSLYESAQVESQVAKLKYDPRFEKLLLKYMNLFAHDLFDRALALGLRQQYSNSHKRDRSIFIYKGLIQQDQFTIMEIQ